MTKSWQAFDGKVRNLKQHIQLLDLALNVSKNKCESIRKAGNSKGTIGLDLGAKQNSHLHMNHPNDTKNLNRLIAFSRSKTNEQVIVDLYRLFSDYMVNILDEIFAKKPTNLLSLITNKDDKQMTFNEILASGNYECLKEKMVLKIYRSLERQKSTPKLLERIINVTRINIEKSVKNQALLYLEVRHLIIHNNSKADSKFIQMNNADLVKVNNSTKRITIDFALANAAINSVFRLCKTIDDQLISLGLA